MITQQFKNDVVAAIKDSRENYDSDKQHAMSLELSPAIYSRICAGETEKVMSDANWINTGRILLVNARGNVAWNTAKTPVYLYITAMLSKCQKHGISTLICDAADIGKTYTAKEYSRNNKYAVYIDCSQVKSKQKLVRKIAQEFGVGDTGKYSNVYENLVFFLNAKASANPIIILDEAGDLSYDAFLELKALWNATERTCGWCMMGADGLREKIRRAIDCKKVGFTEIFSRYGKRYQVITPAGKDEQEKFTKEQAAMVIKANAPEGTDIQKMLRGTDGSLRRIYNELTKAS